MSERGGGGRSRARLLPDGTRHARDGRAVADRPRLRGGDGGHYSVDFDTGVSHRLVGRYVSPTIAREIFDLTVPIALLLGTASSERHHHRILIRSRPAWSRRS